MRRTILLLVRHFRVVDVFWDKEQTGHRGATCLGSCSREHYVCRRERNAGILLAGLGWRSLDSASVSKIEQAELVYIHASGIEGPLLAAEVRRYNRTCRIVFDYHDSLAFELYYQLDKRGIVWLYKPAWFLLRHTCRYMLRGVDGVVGISQGQLTELKRLTGWSGSTAVVPNVRSFSKTMSWKPIEGDRLLWIGNVSKGKDLGRLVEWIETSTCEIRLDVFGRIIDEVLKEEISEILGSKVRWQGAFKCDNEIASRISSRAIGVFLGWEDPLRTGINRIASPNKYFTYVNLQVPVILDERLEGLVEEVEAFGAGISVGSQNEFAAAARRIWRDYDCYRSGMMELRKKWLDYEATGVLESLLNDLSLFLGPGIESRDNDSHVKR